MRASIASMRRIQYALAGGLLGLGAPAGLLLVRLMRRGLSARSVVQDVRTDLETYIYTATSTTLAFAVFGGVLGQHADRLAQLATTDPLTGLFNARAFHERLREEWRRAARYQDPLSLLIVDLDGLKRINDQDGHEAGDAALRSVAAAIRHGLREIDLGARLGDDEFGVVAPRTNEESARVLAERLRALVVDGANGLHGRRATISIGIVSLVPSRDDPPTSLLTAADGALYQAKREGGNRLATARPQGEKTSCCLHADAAC
jgi:diguanylate cyclase (GGDEF)-like protein